MPSPPHSPPRSPPAKRPRLSSPTTPTLPGSLCPYMPTVNPSALDFDLPPQCQTTLLSHNIYICLICGKYLHGRSPPTPAYAHSLSCNHHLFLHYNSHQVYCLPDGYRVTDPSFTPLSQALRPTFSFSQIRSLDLNPHPVHTIDSSSRLAGVVPLHTQHAPTYLTAPIQLLLSAPPFRDHLLSTYSVLPNSHPHSNTPPTNPLLESLAHLCACMWAPVALRAHIAPHQLLQVVARESRGKFAGIKTSGDPLKFVAWFLNSLQHPAVADVYRGVLEVERRVGEKIKRTESGFWYLPLDLPPRPLFKDGADRALIPQTALERLLGKYDGVRKEAEVRSGGVKLYRVKKLPPYLLLVVRRFEKGGRGWQKNPCVVHLPLGGVDMGEVLGGNWGTYALIGAVLHEGDGWNGKWRIVVKHKATKSWYDLSDMAAKKTMEQLLSLADTYLLLYERVLRDDGKGEVSDRENERKQNGKPAEPDS